jgi:uncharacterized membrane protein YGL010W
MVCIRALKHQLLGSLKVRINIMNGFKVLFTLTQVGLYVCDGVLQDSLVVLVSLIVKSLATHYDTVLLT